MKFNFNLKSREASSSEKKSLLTSLSLFWNKIYKIIFFIFLLIMSSLGAYIWQKSLSGGGWSAAKKQEYLNAQNNGVVFNESQFKKAFVDVELRKSIQWSETGLVRDVFKAY